MLCSIRAALKKRCLCLCMCLFVSCSLSFLFFFFLLTLFNKAFFLYCVLQLCSVTNTSSSPSHLAVLDLPSSSGCCDIPPPLPSRKSLSMQSLSPPPLPPRPLPPTSNTHNTVQLERQLLSHITPPTTSHGIPNSVSSLIALVRQ